MAMIRPSIILDYAGGASYADPRWVYTRAGTGTAYDRFGRLITFPANTPRRTFSPNSGLAGLQCEGSKTNLGLWSEDFTNAAWTKTSATISADAAAAPDGNTTADTITVSGSGGNISQAVAVSAGARFELSVFAKPAASNWLWLKIDDGSNSVIAWFNVSTGAVGTKTAGAGTVVLSYGQIFEKTLNGFYRCGLFAVTNTSTSLTGSVSAASADNTTPNTADAITAWGVQMTQTASPAFARQSTYIPTTSATVTRNGEASYILFDSSVMSATAGTLFAEIINPMPGNGNVLLGLGDAAGGLEYVRFGYTLNAGAAVMSISLNAATGGVTQAGVSVTNIPAGPDVAIKFAFAFAANDFALVVNGGAAVTDSSGAVPASFLRLGVGSASHTTMQGSFLLRRELYWPARLSNSQMQMLTA